jgi:hypothetical protein
VNNSFHYRKDEEDILIYLGTQVIFRRNQKGNPCRRAESLKRDWKIIEDGGKCNKNVKENKVIVSHNEDVVMKHTYANLFIQSHKLKLRKNDSMVNDCKF